jgi:DNA-binding SARP family transcriptional activator
MQPCRPTASVTVLPPTVRICTLGCFDLFINGVLLDFEGRGPRKPLELLGILVAFGVRGASVGALTDLLWPDADGFDAYRALITTLYRLRRLLVCRGAIHFGAGRLRLEPAVCDVDVWRFEAALNAARDPEQLAAALALDRGAFLEDDPASWALGMRSRLQQAVTRATSRLAPAGRPADKIAVLVRQRAA